MKKNILNRAMFRQVKSPAYGTGISANLVNDEQRQRYNYGGRVGLYDGTSPYFVPSTKSTAQQREDEFRNWYGAYQKSDAPIRDFYINPVGGAGPAGAGGEFQDASQWYYLPDEEHKKKYYKEKFDMDISDVPESAYEKLYGEHSIHGETPENVREGQSFLTTSDPEGKDFEWTTFKDETVMVNGEEKKVKD